jgi:hypothetical protein
MIRTTVAAASLLTLLLSGAAFPHETHMAEVDEARAAAARYASLDAALADGFVQLFDCTDHGHEGAMGIHYIHPKRAGDAKLVLAEPDALMYEPQPDGSRQLVAVEYLVFEADWKTDSPPTFLGQTLRRKTTVGVHPVDPFYEIHVWHWRHNPDGLFAAWNPYVSCKGEK